VGTCVCACAILCMCVHMHMRVSIPTKLTHMCTHACLLAFLCAFLCACVCMRVHMRVQVRACVYVWLAQQKALHKNMIRGKMLDCLSRLVHPAAHLCELHLVSS